jgi:hypothetical protein
LCCKHAEYISVLLLPCRVRWLSVLHWVFWVNTWHDRLYYKLLHGDKDTFALGFALAGHAAQYRQVGPNKKRLVLGWRPQK